MRITAGMSCRLQKGAFDRPRQVAMACAVIALCAQAPFANAQTLSHAIRNRLEALGIEDYTMHGLRKNAGMELAEAGCTVEEIMAVLGHKTPKMALFYCEQARQKVMNENAVGKWDANIEKNAAKKLAKKRSLLRAVS